MIKYLIAWLILSLAILAVVGDVMVPTNLPPLIYMTVSSVSNRTESIWSNEISNRSPFTATFSTFYTNNPNVTYNVHYGLQPNRLIHTNSIGTNTQFNFPFPYITPNTIIAVSSYPFILQKSKTPNGPWVNIATNYVCWSMTNPPGCAEFRVLWESNIVQITTSH